MPIRRLCLALIATAIPAAAVAHEHKMDLYGGGGIESGSTLVGVHSTLALALPGPKVDGVKVLSAELDTSVHWGSSDKRRANILGGLRYTLAQDTNQTTLPYLHVLFGAAENRRSGSGGWDGAFGVGGGFDAMIGGAHAKWAVRGQVDYIAGPGKNGARVTAGVVRRWSE